MKITAIMPCPNNPTQVANALWLWNRQTHDDKYLILLDDYDYFNTQQGDNWILYSSYISYTGSLEAMYKQGMALAPSDTDAFVFWEGQNTYLPNYLEYHAKALVTSDVSVPSVVFMHGDYLSTQENIGYMHSVIAFNSSLADNISSYTNTSSFGLTFTNWLRSQTSSFGNPWSKDTLSNPYYCQVVVGDPRDYYVHPSAVMTIDPGLDYFQRNVLSYESGTYRIVELTAIESQYTSLLLPKVELAQFFQFQSEWSIQ